MRALPSRPNSTLLCEASRQIATNAERLDVAYGFTTVATDPE